MDLILIIILLSFSENKNHMKANILKLFGDHSYGIFYIHCLFMALIEKVLKVFDANQSWIIFFDLTFISTALLSGLFVNTLRNILLKQKYGRKILNMIGF